MVSYEVLFLELPLHLSFVPDQYALVLLIPPRHLRPDACFLLAFLTVLHHFAPCEA